MNIFTKIYDNAYIKKQEPRDNYRDSIVKPDQTTRCMEKDRLSEEERRADALALRAEERRDKLR